MLHVVPSVLVGLVLLASGLVKILDPRRFLEQVKRYRLLPSRLSTQVAAGLVVALEVALGTALVISAWPGVILPASAAMIAALAGLTMWAAAAGRIDDCGCYGPLLTMRPWQSLGLDAVYLGLLAVAWIHRPPDAAGALWQVATPLLVALAGLAACQRGQRQPWANLAPLRRGRRFDSRWLENPDSFAPGEPTLVVFLSKTCPYCQKWVPLLNVIEAQAETPRVVGLLGLDENERATFAVEHGVRFPLEPIAPGRLRTLVDIVPTAVLVEQGRIQQVFEGTLPADYIEKIRGFYESVQAPPVATARERFAG